jgi:CheY-like chemotaxis protein
MSTENARILVVDDEMEIRSLIVEFLREIENYIVFEAKDAQDALDFLEHNSVDLILSDINMPGMKGFDLLKEVRTLYPTIKRVLITAYNVEDYLELAMKYDIGNIFVKTTPFNFDELSTVLSSLLSNNIFGVDKYFPATPEKLNLSIANSKQLDIHAAGMVSFIGELPYDAKKLELVIIELLTNAIFYGIRKESPENKDSWKYDFVLPDDEAVQVIVAKDSEKFAISITDLGGRLTKRDVLYWLNRQIAHDDDGLPLGLYDSHGRGLFITRKYIDRLIVNIDQSRRTEVIVINYFHNSYVGYKPLYINEL